MAPRAVSLARRHMPASRDSFDQQQQGLSAAPSRRHNSATGASPRRPARVVSQDVV
jgi:hypothetical protein